MTGDPPPDGLERHAAASGSAFSGHTLAGDASPEAAREQALPSALAGLEALDLLGGQLVWRIGKDDLSDAVVVRLGYASATPRFAHRPRLRSASDQELQAALDSGQLLIEWVD